jgi:4-carboxymuconolactone decarboxylase
VRDDPVTDPYRLGLDILAQTGAAHDKHRNRAAEVAPDFVKLAVGFTYGEILSRPGLDLKLRIFSALSACAAIGSSPAQLRTHVAAALHLGWSKAEIIEVLIQSSAHAGLAAALETLSECHDLLVDRDTHCPSCGEEPVSDGQL